MSSPFYVLIVYTRAHTEHMHMILRVITLENYFYRRPRVRTQTVRRQRLAVGFKRAY